MMTRFLLLLLALFPATSWPEVVAITNGRLVTMDDAGIIESGTLLIRDGRIDDVGREVAVPADARIYDAAGRTVTPGLFDPFSHLGLIEVVGFADANDAQNGNAGVTASFDVSWGIDGYTTPVAAARADGVTRAAVFPATGQSIFSGQGALIALLPRPDIVQVPRAFSVVQLGNRGVKAAGGARGTAWMLLRDGLSIARSGSAGSRIGRTEYDALARAASGQVPLIIHVERAADILNALELKQDYPGLQLVLSGASEGWKVAHRVAAADVPVIVDPHANLPLEFETAGATLATAARLSAAGVSLAFSSASLPAAAGSRNLRYSAGVAVANGIEWEAGIRGITLVPARIYGLDDELGSLTPGKRADIVVWSGDPLEFSSRAERVFIDGVPMPLTTRPAALLERYR